MKLGSVDWRQKPNPRERIIFFGTLVVMLFGFVKSCWLPSREAISILKEDLTKVEQEAQVAREMKDMPTQPLSAVPTMISPALRGIGKVRDVDNIVKLFSQPLLLKGVQIKAVKISPPEHEGNMVRRRLELTVTGNFYAVGQYIESLEGFETPYIIEDFSMVRGGDKSSMVTVTLKGLVYGRET
jgi:hypothetical protein